MNRDELVDLWLQAEEDNRQERLTECLEKKDLFAQKILELNEEDTQYVYDYLESVGG